MWACARNPAGPHACYTNYNMQLRFILHRVGSFSQCALRTTAGVLLCAISIQSAGLAAEIPAYLSPTDAKKAQAPVLSPDQFADPQVQRAYRIAKRMPSLLAQQPCYCWCSKGGHHSLLSCYQDRHASQCDVCMQEAFLAEQLTKQGKTPDQIRQAIIKRMDQPGQ